MIKREFCSESGKSILELIVVLVVAAILLTMAITRMGSAKGNLQRQNLATELKVHLERARFDSVKRRPASTPLDIQSRIKLLSATSYSVTTDTNQNGTLDSFETQQISFPSFSDVKIVGSSMTFPMTIRFDWRGKATAYNAADQPIAMPQLYFCEGSGCSASTATASNSNIITISPTGTVSMSKGGVTIPTFLSPNVSNVNSNLGLNPLVKVNGN